MRSELRQLYEGEMQAFNHLVAVLVVHHAEDEAALAGRLRHDLGSQHLPSRHVVARVACLLYTSISLVPSAFEEGLLSWHIFTTSSKASAHPYTPSLLFQKIFGEEKI